jgi:hypothetical protein
MHTLPSPLHIDAGDTVLLSDPAQLTALELDQPVPQGLCGEMLDVELPWFSSEEGFRGYEETGWWSWRNTPEMALN